MGQSNDVVGKYDDVFSMGDVGVASKIKMKLINYLIQIGRPVNWSLENIS
jgi:hypothetical protein